LYWKVALGAVAFTVVGFFIGQQSWLRGATLNDPKAAPRAISARGELWNKN